MILIQQRTNMAPAECDLPKEEGAKSWTLETSKDMMKSTYNIEVNVRPKKLPDCWSRVGDKDNDAGDVYER